MIGSLRSLRDKGAKVPQSQSHLYLNPDMDCAGSLWVHISSMKLPGDLLVLNSIRQKQCLSEVMWANYFSP